MTRCGVGVVEGAPWPGPGQMVAVEVIRTPAGRRGRATALCWRSRTPLCLAIDRISARRRRRRAGVQSAQRPYRHGDRAGGWDWPSLAAARAGIPDRPAHAHRGQGGRDRVRSGRQSADRRRWSPGCYGLAEAPRPADAADALALAICQIWRGSAQAKIAAASARSQPAALAAKIGPMIASVSGRVAALGPDGAVIEVGGVGLSVSCSPATLARLRVGETRAAGDEPGRPGGLAHPLRLRRRRRAGPVRTAADGQRRRPEAGADDSGRAAAARGPARGRHGRLFATLVKVPGIGRKGAERIVLELRDRIGAIDEPGARARTRSPPSRRGVISSGHALAGLGFTG